MNKKLKIVLIALISLVSLIGLVSFVSAQWKEPSTAPPGGQVPAPINVGSDNQWKEGYLRIGDKNMPKEGGTLEAIGGKYGVYGQGTFAGVCGIKNASNYGYLGGWSNYGIYGVGSHGGIYVEGDKYGIYAKDVGGGDWAGYFQGKVNINGELCFNGTDCGDWSAAGLWEQVDSTDKMKTKHDDWKVGIGTESPNHLLDLGPTIGNKLAVYQNAAGDDFYGLGISGGTLEFHAQNNGTTDGPGMVLKGSGNVGIGADPGNVRLAVYALGQSPAVEGKIWRWGATSLTGVGIEGEMIDMSPAGNIAIGRLAYYKNGDTFYGVYGQGQTAGVYGQGVSNATGGYFTKEHSGGDDHATVVAMLPEEGGRSAEAKLAYKKDWDNWYGVYGQGSTAGILGFTDSGGYGVAGANTYDAPAGGTAYGVAGFKGNFGDWNAPAWGALGMEWDNDYVGVYGKGQTNGVRGEGGDYGVYGLGITAGVRGTSSYGLGILADTEHTGAGVYGQGGHGIIGFTTSRQSQWGEGVVGVADVAGNFKDDWWNTGTAYGVLGKTMGNDFAGIFGRGIGDIIAGGVCQPKSGAPGCGALSESEADCNSMADCSPVGEGCVNFNSAGECSGANCGWCNKEGCLYRGGKDCNGTGYPCCAWQLPDCVGTPNCGAYDNSTDCTSGIRSQFCEWGETVTGHSYAGIFEGDVKVTGKLEVTGEIDIGGSTLTNPKYRKVFACPVYSQDSCDSECVGQIMTDDKSKCTFRYDGSDDCDHVSEKDCNLTVGWLVN